MKRQLLAITILLVLDLVWIYLVMGPRYGKMVSKIQGDKMKVNPLYAFLSYALMVVGLLVFVLPLVRKGHELVDSLKYALVFGIVLYGVYDFTAAAVLSGWDMKLALLDIAWGGFVYFIAAYAASKAFQ